MRSNKLCSLISLKCWINIVLLGQACDLIEKHRSTLERKAPPARVCTSLPSSRHHSMEDIPSALAGGNSKSTPHTPTPSQSSSLADISAQAAIMQESLETSMFLSDSQVSLNSLDISEGRELRILGVIDENNQENNGASAAAAALRGFSTGGKHRSILRQQQHPRASDHLRRRVSLQEATSNSLKYEPL